jgi:predicted TPR repeat methyltransferase
MSNEWFDRAVRCREEGRTAEAIALYRQAIAHTLSRAALEGSERVSAVAQTPSHPDRLSAVAQTPSRPALEGSDPILSLAHEQLAKLLYREGREHEAAEVYRQWHLIDSQHPVAAHLHAATGGAAAPPRACDDFIVNVFDRAAPTFDAALEALGYRAPQLLLEQLATSEGEPRATLDVLDLGCGTGLCGALMRTWARKLVGVDLSPAMLEQSRLRGVYDALHAAEVTQFLNACTSAPLDLIVAADVLCYFGDLGPVLTGAASNLRAGGRLLFSVEDLEAPTGFALRPHGRYAHSASYIEQALTTAGFSATITPDYMLRFERGAPVAGLLVNAVL